MVQKSNSLPCSMLPRGAAPVASHHANVEAKANSFRRPIAFFNFQRATGPSPTTPGAAQCITSTLLCKQTYHMLWSCLADLLPVVVGLVCRALPTKDPPRPVPWTTRVFAHQIIQALRSKASAEEQFPPRQRLFGGAVFCALGCAPASALQSCCVPSSQPRSKCHGSF